ncbi:hypothetical protein ABZ570_11310 [Micromonospora sp. NPDC007271]|uniref:hypothetical protein n=1 Tax=Micromonospora sp. NPDC007271 TaxID=3154587 RepID=UPI003400F73B
MRYFDLQRANSYYSVAETAELSWRTVAHPKVEAFSRAVLRLSRLARQQDDDTGWRTFLYPARRARNILTTVPLPFSHPDLGVLPLLSQLKHSLPSLRIYAGDDAAALGEAIVDSGEELIQLEEAPLAEKVLELASNEDSTDCGLLLPIAEYEGAVSNHLLDRVQAPSIRVLTRHSVIDAYPLARLLIVGPLYWYGDSQFVLASPRARKLVVINWAWYREQSPSKTALEGSRGGAGYEIHPIFPAARTGFQTSIDDYRQTVDWQSISRDLVGSGDSEVDESVHARAAVLAGRQAVLLPEDGDRSVWLLEPHAPLEHRVARVDVADLAPGHVIILRTSGGGSLIAPIADEILGDDATQLRSLQRLWKQSLQRWVWRQGTIAAAAAVLRRTGCARASQQNLQNWLSERSLRTEDPGDWKVLMEVSGLEPQAEMVWRAMGRLHRAHLEAGMSIGRRLREMANTEPLDALISSGSQVFRIGRGASLTAFRIEGFSPTSVRCSPSQLLVPIQVRDEWLT